MIKAKDSFEYIVISVFLDLDYLKKIDNYFDKVTETLYVEESVPQSVMTKLDIYNIRDKDQLEVSCISNFSESNKSLQKLKNKKVEVKKTQMDSKV